MNTQSIFWVVCVVLLCSMAFLAIRPLQKKHTDNDLDDCSHSETDSQLKEHSSKANNLTRLFLLLAIPLLTIFLYIFISDRGSVIQQWQSQSNYEQVVQSYYSDNFNDDFSESDKESEITAARQLAQDFYQKHLHNLPAKQQNQLLQAMIHEVHTHSDKTQYWFQLAELMVTMSQHAGLNQDYLINGADTAYHRAYHLANKQPSTHTRPMHAQNHSFYYGIVYAQYNFQKNRQSLDDYAYQTLQNLIQRQPEHEGAYMMLLMHHIGKKEYKMAYDIANQLEKSLVNKGNRNSAIEKIQQIKQTISTNLKVQDR